MKRSLLAVLAILGLCFCLACRERAVPTSDSSAGPNAGPDIQADVAAIKAMEDEFVRLYNACEFDKLMAFFYADDIVLMGPDGPPIHGKDAILRSYLKDDALNIEHVETSVVEDVRVSGNLAVARGRDTGTTTARKGGKPVPYDLKWVMAFVRQPDRTWKCCYEIWCENPPPKAPRGTD
jgi:ketosteroid isomerase-like protein